MRHALETLRDKRNSVASEAQRVKIALGNARESVKNLEGDGQNLERQLKELDAALNKLDT